MDDHDKDKRKEAWKDKLSDGMFKFWFYVMPVFSVLVIISQCSSRTG